jgi:hypothetical protein
MIKFVHKKHMHGNRSKTRFVIYYSAFDIVLGFLLVILVFFFATNYIQENSPGPAAHHPADIQK